MSKNWGYARCSTNEDKQDINRQIRELKAAGAEEVIFEYEHGDAKVKKNLQLLLDSAEAGDTIITLEVSRLSRSTKQLCGIIDIIKEKHLRLIIVGSITIDCRKGEIDPMSKAFLEMSGVFAELEQFVAGALLLFMWLLRWSLSLQLCFGFPSRFSYPGTDLRCCRDP